MDRHGEAVAACRRALDLAGDAAERGFPAGRLVESNRLAGSVWPWSPPRRVPPPVDAA